MKRGFLFGLGSFLVIAAMGSPISALIGTFGLPGIIAAFICMPLSLMMIRAASSAPSHRSRLHAVVGWCFGFFAIDAAILAAIGAAVLVPLLVK
jgi:hypothetical protein